MNTTWKIIFAVQKGTPANAQAVYHALLNAALTYRYGSTGLGAVPTNPAEITDAVFGISDQDSVTVKFLDATRVISGKDLKELLVASIYLKYIEGHPRYADGTGFFVVQPLKTTSTDVGIMVAKPETIAVHGDNTLRLSDDNEPHLLQIKEYYDYRKTQAGFQAPEPISIEKLNDLAGDYEEITIIYLRMLLEFNTAEFKTFFDAHPTTIVVGTPLSAEIVFTPADSQDGATRTITLPQGKHNYVITLPGNSFAVVSFDKPPFIL